MLTGEDDWSNMPAMSQATCGKIPGGKLDQAMSGLGHFPAVRLSLTCLVYCVVVTLNDLSCRLKIPKSLLGIFSRLSTTFQKKTTRA